MLQWSASIHSARRCRGGFICLVPSGHDDKDVSRDDRVAISQVRLDWHHEQSWLCTCKIEA